MLRSVPATPHPSLYAVAAAAGAGIAALLMLTPSVDPLLTGAAVVAIPGLALAMRKFPAAFIVPVIFIPQVKDWPAFAPLQSRVDLTAVFIVLVGTTILLQLAADLIGQDGWSFQRLLAGQGMGIAAFAVFAAVVAVSYVYTPAPGYGGWLVARLWTIGGLLFISPLLLVRREQDFRHFVIAFVACAIALAVGMLLRLEGRARTETHDLALIAAGWVMGMALLQLLYYRLADNRARQALVMLVCLPLLAVGLLSSASRGPILSLLAVVIITSVLLRQRGSMGVRVAQLVALLAVLLVTYSVFVTFIHGFREAREKYESKTTELEQLWGGGRTARSGGQRLPLYASALQAMSEHPLAGLGVGGWSVYYYGRDRIDDPHNLFLQVGAEEGLVGLLALIALLATAFSSSRMILRRAGDRFLVLPALLLFVLSTSMFSGNLDDDRLLWIWCGMTFAVCRMEREKDPREDAAGIALRFEPGTSTP